MSLMKVSTCVCIVITSFTFLGVTPPSAASGQPINCTDADILCTTNSSCRGMRTLYVRFCFSLLHLDSTKCSEECWTAYMNFLQIARLYGVPDCNCTSHSASCSATWLHNVRDVCGTVWNSPVKSSILAPSTVSLTPHSTLQVRLSPTLSPEDNLVSPSTTHLSSFNATSGSPVVLYSSAIHYGVLLLAAIAAISGNLVLV